MLPVQELIQQLRRDVLTDVSGVEWQDIAGLGELGCHRVVRMHADCQGTAGLFCFRKSTWQPVGDRRAHGRTFCSHLLLGKLR